LVAKGRREPDASARAARPIGHLTDAAASRIRVFRSIKMKRAKQIELPLRTWGGKRAGAGRKPKGARPGVPHRPRPVLSRHHPVHVTWRMLPHVRNLRTRCVFREIVRAFVSAQLRAGFRLVHFSIQGNHVHLVCEAVDQRSLSRALQSLAIRIARALNRLMRRRGTVFADRFYEHVLRTAREVANAVAYVVGNFAVHALRRGLRVPERFMDPFSSAAAAPPVVREPVTWLLRVGSRRAAQPLASGAPSNR
jgi:REP element-mobilizing transposase RayT